RINLETEAILEPRCDGLALEINVNRVRLGYFQKSVDGVLRQCHGEDAILEGVARKDVGKAWRDHAGHAHVEQRPGGVLAARSAAEVVAGDQDWGALELRIGED